MKKMAVAILLVGGIWAACTRESPVQQDCFSTVKGDIVIGKLDVNIIYDDTPGFLYPMMRHEIDFVGYLDVRGFIDYYSYQSGQVGSAVILDFFGGYCPPPGETFTYKNTLWGPDLFQPGTSVNYQFEANAPQARPLTVRGAKIVERRSNSPRPESNSQQLTGTTNSNDSPLFSQDGIWIYFRGYDRRNNRCTISRLPVSVSSTPEVIIDTADPLGGFALTDNDKKLAVVLHKPYEQPKLVQYDLTTGAGDTTVIPGFSGGSILVSIPGTQQFLSLSQAEAQDAYASDLILIDLDRRTVETLFDSQVTGELLHVGYRPGTREVSFGQKIVHPYWNVVLLNLDTRESKIFLNNFELIDFAWASNGRDFIYSKPIANQGQNLFLSEAGNTRQITFYPGFDQQPTISPDGQKIAFASRRRQELQVWRLDL